MANPSLPSAKWPPAQRLSDQLSALPQLPVRFEPGDALPSRMLIAHMRALHRQALLVDVLGWVLENEAWLTKSTLEIRFDHTSVQPQACHIHWAGPVHPRTKGMASRALYRLSTLLDFMSDRDHDALPMFSRHLIHALNAVHWQPHAAIAALAPLAPHSPNQETVPWLTRHASTIQQRLLRRKTHRPGMEQGTPTRRL